ncbi:hypothetical protein FVB32_01695 [Flagellimonas hymeniacidonis]|uniref:Uncharacterized protein n=1 Tax=Flagellimonas hymeniacidonis TaxID=2603628 RepID=A0A5C8V6J6_9FLAO|nr:hypothetical protein [Flagellimonas hymeniacidonis]TXN37026.1 hypothetical protein FVB32_01695 [Flagellimonas hymeniacidonis]
MSTQKTYPPKSFSKWLLSTAFLLSILSSPSAVGQSSLVQTIPPIELISTSKLEIGKRTIRYKSAVASYKDIYQTDFSKNWELCLSRTHSQQDKVEFDSYSNKIHTIILSSSLHLVTRISQNSKEHASSIT